MLTLIPTDGIPLGMAIRANYSAPYGESPFVLEQYSGFYPYTAHRVNVRPDGWIGCGQGGGSSITTSHSAVLRCYREWLPEDRYSGFEVYFGYRIRVKRVDGFKKLCIGHLGQSEANIQKFPVTNNFVTEIDRDYYLEVRIVVPPVGTCYVDTWIDGQHIERFTVSNPTVETHFRNPVHEIVITIPATNNGGYLNGDRPDVPLVKDMYIATSLEPNPIRNRLGPIVVQSHYPKVSPDTTTWESANSALTMDEVLTTPVTDVSNPFPEAIRTKDNYTPLQLKLDRNEIDDTKRYVGAQVHYHATKQGDLTKSAHISINSPGIITGTEPMDITEFPWLGTAFRPHVTKSTGIDTLTADDLANTTITITPVDSLE